MKFENKNIYPNVKTFIEEYIEIIDQNKFPDIFDSAVIDAELNEIEFDQLCEILEEIKLPANEERNEFFINLFSQYMEAYEHEYEQNDADRLVEMMDCMSTANCLGLDLKSIKSLLNKWSTDHPNRIQVEGDTLSDCKIRFLNPQLGEQGEI